MNDPARGGRWLTSKAPTPRPGNLFLKTCWKVAGHKPGGLGVGCGCEERTTRFEVLLHTWPCWDASRLFFASRLFISVSMDADTLATTPMSSRKRWVRWMPGNMTSGTAVSKPDARTREPGAENGESPIRPEDTLLGEFML